MDRIFISIGPIDIYWYSVLIVVSIVIGMYFSLKEADKNGLGRDFLYDMIFYLIPVGIIGARTYYVIFNFSLFKDNLTVKLNHCDSNLMDIFGLDLEYM